MVLAVYKKYKQPSPEAIRVGELIANHLKNITSFPVYSEYMKELLQEWQTREE